jgi:photosynthetic reaction center cytochrome c subunit
MPRAQLLGTMKFFSQSLGVRCTFCHVGEEGKPLSTFDFAADTKAKKQTARAMLAMVTALNAKTLPDATGLPDAKVTCFTCHRGSTKPLTAPPPPEAPAIPAPAKPPERG